jgi:hypothetical protein
MIKSEFEKHIEIENTFFLTSKTINMVSLSFKLKMNI